jgi:hypothetical protein
MRCAAGIWLAAILFLPLANLGFGQTESILRQRNFRGVLSNHHDLGTISIPWRNIYGGKFIGDGSGLTGVTATATNANSSFATNATFALYSTNAGSSGYATNAGRAGYATNAGSSGYATNAGRAGYATNAGSAGFATNASFAGFATNALWASNVPPRALIRTNAAVTAGMIYHWLTGETGYWAYVLGKGLGVQTILTNFSISRTLNEGDGSYTYETNVYTYTATTNLASDYITVEVFAECVQTTNENITEITEPTDLATCFGVVSYAYEPLGGEASRSPWFIWNGTLPDMGVGGSVHEDGSFPIDRYRYKIRPAQGAGSQTRANWWTSTARFKVPAGESLVISNYHEWYFSPSTLDAALVLHWRVSGYLVWP